MGHPSLISGVLPWTKSTAEDVNAGADLQGSEVSKSSFVLCDCLQTRCFHDQLIVCIRTSSNQTPTNWMHLLLDNWIQDCQCSIAAISFASGHLMYCGQKSRKTTVQKEMPVKITLSTEDFYAVNFKTFKEFFFFKGQKTLEKVMSQLNLIG